MRSDVRLLFCLNPYSVVKSNVFADLRLNRFAVLVGKRFLDNESEKSSIR